MQLHATRSTFHIAACGIALIGVGMATKAAPIIAFGGGVLLAVAVGRALAVATIGRLRSAGFEMVWTSGERVHRVARGETLRIEAELRNRGPDDVRGVNLRAIASSMLSVRTEPDAVSLPGHSAVRVTVEVTPKRVGRWGLHGLALEVRGTPLGGDGLFEVPLLFANPHGIEATTGALHALVERPLGGRARRAMPARRTARRRGEGEEVRELRAFAPGDPFRRIAWKASARRGSLVVREWEDEEQGVVWLVLDASVELWAGPLGRAPLDLAIDDVSKVAAAHLGAGTEVGLAIVASRLRAWIPPDADTTMQLTRIREALLGVANLVDEERCELDEPDIAKRVADHLRPLDPRGLADLTRGDLDTLAGRAEAMMARAPFAPRLPAASSKRDATLRQYLAAYGIEVPPRVDGEGSRSPTQLAVILDELARMKKVRPSLVHVWAPAELTQESKDAKLAQALRRLRHGHTKVLWTLPRHALSLAEDGPAVGSAAVQAGFEAVRLRAEATATRSARSMRRLGVRMRRAPE